MLNGQVVQNNTEVVELTGGALPGDVNDPGPLRLQGDHGKVWYPEHHHLLHRRVGRCLRHGGRLRV